MLIEGCIGGKSHIVETEVVENEVIEEAEDGEIISALPEHSLDRAIEEYRHLPFDLEDSIRWGFIGVWRSGGRSGNVHSIITISEDDYFDKPHSSNENVAAFAAAFTNPNTIKVCKYLFRNADHSRATIMETCQLSDEELDVAVKPLLEWHFAEWKDGSLESISHGINYVVTLVGMTQVAVDEKARRNQKTAPVPESMPEAKSMTEVTLYTISDTGNLVKLDIVAESFDPVVIGNLGESFLGLVEGLAMSPDGLLYAAVNSQDAESKLYSINTQTAEATLVGTMNQRQVDGLSFSKNGTLYGVTSILGGGYASQLLKVDIKTGDTTPINIGLGLMDLDSLVIGPEDKALITDGVGGDDQFYQIDLTSESNPMLVGPTPDIIPRGRDIEGLALGSDGFLYGTTCATQTDIGISYLARINPETLEYINLGSLEFGAWNLASVRKK